MLVFLFGAFPDDAATATGIDLLWGGLMRTLDPGTMGGDAGWGFRALMLVITIGGLIIVASLIGIVSGAFDSKVEELRKGRSRVLEHDHTLILGWNSKIHSIVHELAIANESRGRASIVVLADKDKVEMEDEIRLAAGNLGKTTVICRTGDPKSLTDLAMVSPSAPAASSCSHPRAPPTPTRRSSRPRSPSPTTPTASPSRTTSSASSPTRRTSRSPGWSARTRPTGCSAPT